VTESLVTDWKRNTITLRMSKEAAEDAAMLQDMMSSVYRRMAEDLLHPMHGPPAPPMPTVRRPTFQDRYDWLADQLTAEQYVVFADLIDDARDG